MRFSWLLVSLYCVTTLLVSGYVYDADYLIPRECDLCRAKTCPQLTYCIGEVVKDHCGCCKICSSDLFPTKTGQDLPATQVKVPSTRTPVVDENKSDDPCEKRQCPKFKVCMINIQGLPICACPSSFVCKNHGKKGKAEDVCGMDGKTYESRCHLRIASCNAARRIKRKHSGACTEADIAEIKSKKTINRPTEKTDFNEVDFGTNINKEEAKYLSALTRVKKRRLRKKKKQEKKKRRQRKKERKERLKKKGNKRQKRMKRRNEGYNLYSRNYGYLMGRRTKWGRSQVRKSRM